MRIVAQQSESESAFKNIYISCLSGSKDYSTIYKFTFKLSGCSYSGIHNVW